MDNRELLLEVKCLVLYHLEVMDSLENFKDKELENLRFNKFLNRLISKYEYMEGYYVNNK